MFISSTHTTPNPILCFKTDDLVYLVELKYKRRCKQEKNCQRGLKTSFIGLFKLIFESMIIFVTKHSFVRNRNG